MNRARRRRSSHPSTVRSGSRRGASRSFDLLGRSRAELLRDDASAWGRAHRLLKPGTCVVIVRWWLASALFLLAGCGSDGEPRAGSDREQMEAAMTGYLEALADGDGEGACSHVAEQAQRDMTTITDAR